MLILGLLGIYFDAVVVFVTKSSLLSRLAVAILCTASQIIGGDFAKVCGLLKIYELYYSSGLLFILEKKLTCFQRMC